MNTAEYIPMDCVAPIMLEHPDHPDYPFFSGTGFFVFFPPFDDLFFVTAKHCIFDSDGKEKGHLKIQYQPGQMHNHAISFDEYFLTQEQTSDEYEDLVVFSIQESSPEKIEQIRARALRLQHQEDIEAILNAVNSRSEKLRLVGYPSTSKDIDYTEKKAVVQPRGLVGNAAGPSETKNRFRLNNLNWKETTLDGFSGSPVLFLGSDGTGNVIAAPIGVLLTGTESAAHFLSINAATDLIAAYLLKKYKT